MTTTKPNKTLALLLDLAWQTIENIRDGNREARSAADLTPYTLAAIADQVFFHIEGMGRGDFGASDALRFRVQKLSTRAIERALAPYLG